MSKKRMPTMLSDHATLKHIVVDQQRTLDELRQYAVAQQHAVVNLQHAVARLEHVIVALQHSNAIESSLVSDANSVEPLSSGSPLVSRGEIKLVQTGASTSARRVSNVATNTSQISQNIFPTTAATTHLATSEDKHTSKRTTVISPVSTPSPLQQILRPSFTPNQDEIGRAQSDVDPSVAIQEQQEIKDTVSKQPKQLEDTDSDDDEGGNAYMRALGLSPLVPTQQQQIVSIRTPSTASIPMSSVNKLGTTNSKENKNNSSNKKSSSTTKEKEGYDKSKKKEDYGKEWDGVHLPSVGTANISMPRSQMPREVYHVPVKAKTSPPDLRKVSPTLLGQREKEKEDQSIAKQDSLCGPFTAPQATTPRKVASRQVHVIVDSLVDDIEVFPSQQKIDNNVPELDEGELVEGEHSKQDSLFEEPPRKKQKLAAEILPASSSSNSTSNNRSSSSSAKAVPSGEIPTAVPTNEFVTPAKGMGKETATAANTIVVSQDLSTSMPHITLPAIADLVGWKCFGIANEKLYVQKLLLSHKMSCQEIVQLSAKFKADASKSSKAGITTTVRFSGSGVSSYKCRCVGSTNESGYIDVYANTLEKCDGLHCKESSVSPSQGSSASTAYQAGLSHLYCRGCEHLSDVSNIVQLFKSQQDSKIERKFYEHKTHVPCVHVAMLLIQYAEMQAKETEYLNYLYISPIRRLDNTQINRFKEMDATYHKNTVVQLDRLLKEKKCSTSGTKEAKIARLIEVALFGPAAACKSCGSRMNFAMGVYHCPGKYNENTKMFEQCDNIQL